jgi:hypothetical protein
MEKDDPTEMSGYEAALGVGEKVIEMADRVADLNAAVPGAEAKWTFEMDGSRFQVTVKKLA